MEGIEGRQQQCAKKGEEFRAWGECSERKRA